MIDINLSSFTNIIKPFFFNDLVAISFLGKNFKNLTRWYEEISKRDAVVRGFAFMNKDELPPKP